MTRSKRSYDDCAGASSAPTEIDSYEYLKKVTSSGRTGMLNTARVSRTLLETCIVGMNTGILYRIIPNNENTRDDISYAMGQRWADISLVLQSLNLISPDN